MAEGGGLRLVIPVDGAGARLSLLTGLDSGLRFADSASIWARVLAARTLIRSGAHA